MVLWLCLQEYTMRLRERKVSVCVRVSGGYPTVRNGGCSVTRYMCMVGSNWGLSFWLVCYEHGIPCIHVYNYTGTTNVCTYIHVYTYIYVR